MTGRRKSDGPISVILGLDAHVADPSDQIIMELLARLHGHHFNRVSVVVRPQNQMIARNLDIFHRSLRGARPRAYWIRPCDKA